MWSDLPTQVRMWLIKLHPSIHMYYYHVTISWTNISEYGIRSPKSAVRDKISLRFRDCLPKHSLSKLLSESLEWFTWCKWDSINPRLFYRHHLNNPRFNLCCRVLYIWANRWEISRKFELHISIPSLSRRWKVEESQWYAYSSMVILKFKDVKHCKKKTLTVEKEGWRLQRI